MVLDGRGTFQESQEFTSRISVQLVVQLPTCGLAPGSINKVWAIQLIVKAIEGPLQGNEF